MHQKEKTPTVAVLKSLTPSVESARSDQLRYEQLAPAVEKHRRYDAARQQEFWEAAPGSIEEEQAATQLALQYLLMTAIRAANPTEDDAVTQRWAERYTEAAAELYGEPYAEIARKLLAEQAADVLSHVPAGAANELADRYRQYLDKFGVSPESAESNEAVFAPEAAAIEAVLTERYADVYAALEDGLGKEPLPPAEVADRFEWALATLVQGHDPAWAEWSIDRNEDKDSLSVGERNTIVVGMRRASMRPDQLRGLFSHEVLLHAQRALNGKKLGGKLKSRLPGYLSAEEGAGIFFEYAVTGEVPVKTVDRYVDIAIAMGKVGPEAVTRKELIDFTLTRALLRNEAAPAADRDSVENIQKAAYAHVNRIYRGTLGDEHVGVFTKDSVYYRGFLRIGKFIREQLESGQTAAEVYDYIVAAKFDPTNDRHNRLVRSQLAMS